MLVRVLLATSDDREADRVVDGLEQIQGVLLTRSNNGDLQQQLASEVVDLLVVDRASLGDDPAGALQQMRALGDDPEIIVLTRGKHDEDEARLQAAGAFAVVPGGLARAPLTEALGTLVQRRAAQGPRESVAAPGAHPRLAESASPRMLAMLSVLERVAPTNATLLLQGETGVGKEYLARAVHERSGRAGSFIPVNCAALPESLIESELFGHARGAFTGASRARRGRFEVAHRGTLFLDEIGEIPLATQAKLLRVLDDKVIQPLGAERSLAVDVRILVATNRDLAEEVAAGRFRDDLYYRVSVVTLDIPPLRERREDIPRLARELLAACRRSIATRVTDIEPATMERLVGHAWPGNVRELANTIERAVLLARGDVLTPDDLPARLRAAALEHPARTASIDLAAPYRAARAKALEGFDRQYVERLLERSGGKVGAAAQRAGLSPRSLFEKMRRLGLAKEDYREHSQG